MTARSVRIANPLGMHARAAARFVRVAATYESQIRVSRDARTVDGKSIMGLLLLAAACGSDITISADGPDERETLDALCGLVTRGFEEFPV